MAKRRRDQIVVESPRGVFDAFSKLELTTDLTDIASLTFTFGDDSSWATVADLVTPGTPFKVFLDNRLQFTGRVEVNEAPIDASNGTTIDITCRTKLSDAHYSSAPKNTRVTNVSIKDFLLALYAPFGYTRQDFEFDPMVELNLLTGEQMGKSQDDPDAVTPVDKAKISPPETVWEAANKHLKLRHLMHWDGARGTIIVGKPGSTPKPIYRFLSKRGPASVANNVLRMKRLRDWSEVPAIVEIFGQFDNEDGDTVQLRAPALDEDVSRVFQETGHFNRIVQIPIEGAKNRERAKAQARRELSERIKKKSGWEVEVDGWSYWDGQRSIPYALNYVADLDADTVGAEGRGKFLITKVTRKLSAEEAATTSLTLVGPGLYVL